MDNQTQKTYKKHYLTQEQIFNLKNRKLWTDVTCPS